MLLISLTQKWLVGDRGCTPATGRLGGGPSRLRHSILEVKEQDMPRWPLWLGTLGGVDLDTARDEHHATLKRESGGGWAEKKSEDPRHLRRFIVPLQPKKGRDGEAHCPPLARVPLPLLSFTRMAVVARHYRKDRIASCPGR
jgi:hypothetical protein